nr:glycosyltransferase [Microcystis sp. Msp_OC_L_20101000_S702]
MRTQRERLWIKYDIEKIGVREFRSELPKYLYGETPVEVLRHGHTVGFYFPVKQQGEIWQHKLELVVFGASEPVNPPDFGLKTHYLGRLNDDISLALVYAAADIFVAPSIEDNLPNTVMEALACATPSVAFKIGGMPDMIEHQENGYLAHPFEVEDLASGINWVLEDTERYNQLCIRARQKVEQEFTLEIQASKYLKLYNEIL